MRAHHVPATGSRAVQLHPSRTRATPTFIVLGRERVAYRLGNKTARRIESDWNFCELWENTGRMETGTPSHNLRRHRPALLETRLCRSVPSRLHLNYFRYADLLHIACFPWHDWREEWSRVGMHISRSTDCEGFLFSFFFSTCGGVGCIVLRLVRKLEPRPHWRDLIPVLKRGELQIQP